MVVLPVCMLITPAWAKGFLLILRSSRVNPLTQFSHATRLSGTDRQRKRLPGFLPFPYHQRDLSNKIGAACYATVWDYMYSEFTYTRF